MMKPHTSDPAGNPLHKPGEATKYTDRGKAFFLTPVILASVVLALMATIPFALAEDAISDYGFSLRALEIETQSGESHDFIVEVAKSEKERAKGLMYRSKMDDDAGMLFLLGEDRESQMWMRNTFISLDMLFIDRSGEIVRIVHNTKPLSDEIISSGRPVHAVLELVGGTSKKLGIDQGDRINVEALTP